MSGTQTLTVAAPPSTAECATAALAWIAAQSGVITDFNEGSQIRTEAESVGSVIEMQETIAQAQAFQAIVYSAWAAFNIIPLKAQPSIGQVTITTGTGGSPPPAPFSTVLPAGFLFSTVGGIQFQLTQNTLFQQGATSVTATVQAVVAGSSGNVAGGAITQVASTAPYPLFVNNTNPTTGGADAETPAQTMARFTAAVAAIDRGTPVGIANFAIGIQASGSAETVKFATVYELWIAQLAASGAGATLTPGFTVVVDNGSGSASSALMTAVTTAMNGNQALGQDGNRPAGVPFTVSGVTAIPVSVTVSGTAINPANDATLVSNATAALQSYFQLNFGNPAEIAPLTAQVANSVAGNISSLSVQLFDQHSVQQSYIAAGPTQRIILNSYTVTFN